MGIILAFGLFDMMCVEIKQPVDLVTCLQTYHLIVPPASYPIGPLTIG